MDPQEKYHLTLLSQGKKEALAFLHDKYWAKIFQYCLQFVRSKEVAQEISLDVFLKLWERRSIVKSDRSVSGLLFKISKDYCISYLRKVAKDASLHREFIENYFHRLDNPVEEQLILKERLQIAKQVINTLPPRCRQVFQLRYTEGLSLKQIAAELNISTNTVKKQLKKGTDIVKESLSVNADLVFIMIIANLI